MAAAGISLSTLVLSSQEESGVITVSGHRGALGWLLCLMLPEALFSYVLCKGPWGLRVQIQLLGTRS